MKRAAQVYLIGSVITLGLAYILWKRHQRIAAAALLFVSPFPCPTPLPC